MKLVLSPTEAEIVKIWANSGSTRIAKRAWLVLQFVAGIHPNLIAQAVGMPEQRVLDNIAEFEQDRILGLLDRPRIGRPSKVSAQTRSAIFRLAEIYEQI
ncbi:hypothetical protein BCM14_2682 [Jezberella montanilacus]|uniref:Uncharacterized protein n=1 Tax=Jezberella montanilacus TaxID=323426 RepID=A0A2T0XC00_9BURK|nr:helix-turn-helix domain-containing protein [Jezberella montanilacus]PRY96444.1 hypothetical protein BCM14_2682 [Jezberella montanilacus]